MPRLICLVAVALLLSVPAYPQIHIPLADLVGTIGPWGSLVHEMTLPADLATADSIGVYLEGELFSGLLLCGVFEYYMVVWEVPPVVYISHPASSPTLGFESRMPNPMSPGSYEGVYGFRPLFGATLEGWAGRDVEIWASLSYATPCNILQMPTTVITDAALVIWYPDTTAIEAQSWSAIKALYR